MSFLEVKFRDFMCSKCLFSAICPLSVLYSGFIYNLFNNPQAVTKKK